MNRLCQILPPRSTASRTQFETDVLAAARAEGLRAVRDRYLARKGGLVSALLKALGSAPPEMRPALGKLANDLKQQIEATLERTHQCRRRRRARRPAPWTSRFPAARRALGHRHPLTLLRERIEAIFARMGFLIIEGPELEDDYHNFEALNMPAEHPARDMQDTLYLVDAGAGRSAGSPATLLRTHTSGMQIRYMEAHQPPVRLIAPGRVYRRDNLDLTHTPMFTQVEGLVVGEGISLADLKGTLFAFVRELFGAEREAAIPSELLPLHRAERRGRHQLRRLRRHRARAARCASGPAGSRSWQRHGASGGVRSGRLRPGALHGFAFGMGIERVALLKWGVEDIRLFYENDLRFLEQFPL